MSRRRMLSVRMIVAGFALVAAVHAEGQLASTSPFLPSQNSGPAAPTQNAPLEFRAVMETPEGVQYRVVDPANKKAAWVKPNERNTDLGVVVKQYDADRDTLTVEHEGRTLTLEIRKAKIVSSGPAAQVMAPQPAVAGGAAMLPAVTQTVVPNPTPADEQKRLEAVAQEVARRRALREQAANGQIQPAAVAPQQAVPAQAPAAQPPPSNQATPQGQANKRQANRQR